MLRNRLALVLSLTLMAAACGSPSQSATTSGAPASAPSARDACALITVEEAAKILGSPTTATPRSASASQATCDYVTQAAESFTVEASWGGAEEGIKTARAAAATATSAAGGSADAVVSDVMGLQRIENLGDEAYFSRRGQSYVRRGDVLLTIQTSGLNEPAREHFEALVRAALARLK